jgi:hypothetical protein
MRWKGEMNLRCAVDKLGFALCFVALTICIVVHVGSFVGIVSLIWVVPPFILLGGAVLCSRVVQPRLRLPLRIDKVSLVGFGLLAYSILLFIYFYKTTGGASSVAVIDGRYVSMYKEHVIRSITEEEYQMFPNLWTRVMSAWMAMMAVFCSRSFRFPQWLKGMVATDRLEETKG